MGADAVERQGPDSIIQIAVGQQCGPRWAPRTSSSLSSLMMLQSTLTSAANTPYSTKVPRLRSRSGPGGRPRGGRSPRSRRRRRAVGDRQAPPRPGPPSDVDRHVCAAQPGSSNRLEARSSAMTAAATSRPLPRPSRGRWARSRPRRPLTEVDVGALDRVERADSGSAKAAWAASGSSRPVDDGRRREDHVGAMPPGLRRLKPYITCGSHIQYWPRRQ